MPIKTFDLDKEYPVMIQDKGQLQFEAKIKQCTDGDLRKLITYQTEWFQGDDNAMPKIREAIIPYTAWLEGDMPVKETIKKMVISQIMLLATEIINYSTLGEPETKN